MAHDPTEQAVDTLIRQPAERLDLDGFTEQEASDRQRIDAEVEQRAAGEVGAPVSSVLVEHRNGEVRVDADHLADRAVGDPVSQLDAMPA